MMIRCSIKQTVFMGLVFVLASSISAMNKPLGSLTVVLRVGENKVTQIEKDKLDEFIGKNVLYKFNESDYKPVVLGHKYPGGDFYAAHMGENKTVYCLPESLYQFRQQK